MATRGCLRLAELDPVLDEEGGSPGRRSAGAEGEHLFLGLDERRAAVRAAGADRGARPARLERVPAARADERAGTRRSGARRAASTNGTTAIVSAAFAGRRPAAFRAGWGRKCAGCGAEHFPRVDPVVIMLAEHEGRVLLGRQPQYPAGPLFGAGRLRRARRIDRGSGGARADGGSRASRSSDVRYVASQPWPFPGSLMIACIGRGRSGRDHARHQRARGRVLGDRAERRGRAGRRSGRAFPGAAAFCHCQHAADALE